MPEDRQDLLARLMLHEIDEDEKWMNPRMPTRTSYSHL